MITAYSEIHRMSISPLPIAPCYPETTLDLQVWCLEYHCYNKFPVTTLGRFAIGFYQIHQGLSWKDGGLNKYESFAASALHFIMVSEALNLPLEEFLPIKISDIPIVHIEHAGVALLSHLSSAQQQLWYSGNPNNTKRNSRYKPAKLAEGLGESVYRLIGLIPKELRQDAFCASSTIMTKELK